MKQRLNYSKIKLRKVGGCTVITIPQNCLRQLKWAEEKTVLVAVDGDKLVVVEEE